MKIKKVVGATKEEIESQKFNIFVPISLGNKWFTKENIKSYILWALKYSKEDVIVVIADKLHQVNIEVKDHYSPEAAKRKIEKISARIEKEIKEIIEDIKTEDKTKIRILRWEDIDQARECVAIKKEIYAEFNKRGEFRKAILEIVEESVKKIRGRKFNEKEILKLSEYVLNEMPIILYGARYNNRLYSLHPYPVFTKISDLADKIGKGLFGDFYSEFGKPTGIIVELND